VSHAEAARSTTIVIDLRMLQTTLDFPINTAIFDSFCLKV
jgi:hypothetical protein